MLSVMPKIRSLDPNLADAAMDLGATPWRALTKVIVPQIMPGIVSGALIAFTMSIDDFIISYFVTGGGISYGVIGLGVESRWGSCKFKSFGGGDSEEDEQEPEPGKSKFNGMRVYLSFRF